jgi:hypothetical protein
VGPTGQREREGNGAGLARLGWVTGRYLGPGLAQVAEAFSSPFFCSETFFFFCFPFLSQILQFGSNLIQTTF